MAPANIESDRTFRKILGQKKINKQKLAALKHTNNKLTKKETKKNICSK